MAQPNVAPQVPPAQPTTQAFQNTTQNIDTLLNEIRLLRNEVMKLHKKINAALTGEVDVSDSYWKALIEKVALNNKIYESLEMHAKLLSASSVTTPQLERLTRFLNEAHIDPNIKELYEKCLDVSSWIDTTNQFLQFYVAFFRRVVVTQRRSQILEKPLTYSSCTPVNFLQQAFNEMLVQASNDQGYKKLGLNYRFLEKSTLSAVIEFKYGKVFEKHYVCSQKMLMLVNNGIIESLLLIAPHEDWTYLDEARRWVDIHKDSRYTVYQKLTVQANIHLVQAINNFMDNQQMSTRTLVYVLTLLSKFHEVFALKCKICGRVMKNFLPPTLFDIGRPNVPPLHEACR